MPAFNPGGGTLKNTTFPAAFLEACNHLSNGESTFPPDTRPNFITITVDAEASRANVSASLPIAIEVNPDNGFPEIRALDYSQGSQFFEFDPGANGSLRGDTTPSAVLETAVMLSNYELLLFPEDNRPNNITISFNLEERQAIISASLPIGIQVNEVGRVLVIATNYLGG